MLMNPSLRKLFAVLGVSSAVLLVSGVVLGGHDRDLAAKAGPEEGGALSDETYDQGSFETVGDGQLDEPEQSVPAVTKSSAEEPKSLNAEPSTTKPVVKKTAKKSSKASHKHTKKVKHKKAAKKARKHKKAKKKAKKPAPAPAAQPQADVGGGAEG